MIDVFIPRAVLLPEVGGRNVAHTWIRTKIFERFGAKYNGVNYHSVEKYNLENQTEGKFSAESGLPTWSPAATAHATAHTAAAAATATGTTLPGEMSRSTTIITRLLSVSHV